MAADEIANMTGPTTKVVETDESEVKDYYFTNLTGSFTKTVEIKGTVPDGETWKAFVRIIIDKEE